LPLPTYVEVTNLKNNRKIIVKVNDRGPFKSNRLIDLSYVAAKKLDMLGKGTAQVRVKAISHYANFARHSAPFEKTYPRFHPTYANTKPVFLQVGAFRNKNHAMKLQRRLKILSSTPVIIMSPSRKGSLYKVKIGPFRDVASLAKITHQLKGLGLTPNKTYGA
jgi:rare lipoprotein A